MHFVIFHNFEPFPKYKGVEIDFMDILCKMEILIYFIGGNEFSFHIRK